MRTRNRRYAYLLMMVIVISSLIGEISNVKIEAASNAAIEGYQNPSDQSYLTAEIQIEIFAKNNDYFSQRMLDLFIPYLTSIDGKSVAIRMYDVNEPSIHQYLLNLGTFFNPITPDYLDNPVIVINNNKMITGYTDINNDQILSMIEHIMTGESASVIPGVGVYDLKTTEYEPNMYYSLQTNQVEPKRPNEAWYEQLPTFLFVDLEGFDRVSDTKWIQATAHVEVFVEESCKECHILLNQSLLELVPYLNEIGGAIRVYNLNHQDIQSYLTEFSTYFNVLTENVNEPIVIVNREVLIKGYNIKRPKTYQDVIKKLINQETDLPFLEGIELYPVLEEKASDAQTIYFSEGLSKLAHQISQDPIDLPVEFPLSSEEMIGQTNMTISFSKLKLTVMVILAMTGFILAELYIKYKSAKLKSTQNEFED